LKQVLRILGYLFVIWLGATTNFLLPRLLPGDPAEFLVGEESSRLTAAQREVILAEFGLDKPLPLQYALYWRGLARWDLGFSVGHGRPVLGLIGERLPWTLLLVGSAIVLASVFGCLLAGLFHWLAKPRLSSSLLGTVIFFGSLPPFWLAMVGIAVFAVALGWLPSHGAAAVAEDLTWSSVLSHAVMPVATLTLSFLPAIFLVGRAGLEEALGAPFVALARSQGASPLRVLLRQAAPNAVSPLVNQLAMSFGGLLGGTVVVETVFAYPGTGALLYEGIEAHDFPLVQGIFLLSVFSMVLANLAADLAQERLDPRRAGLEANR